MMKTFDISYPFKAAANKRDHRKNTFVTTSRFQGGEIHAAAFKGEFKPDVPRYFKLDAPPTQNKVCDALVEIFNG